MEGRAERRCRYEHFQVKILQQVICIFVVITLQIFTYLPEISGLGNSSELNHSGISRFAQFTEYRGGEE